ncbi:MAG: AAA family ATPase, partial [Solirubrobacterales bacterium]
MIRELRIENLLLIERAELRFGEGLNAITGETGAGKTVLAHSLDLLLGGKPRSGIVRPGAPEAWVEGCFDLPAELRQREGLSELLDRVPPGEDEVVLARRLSAAGRSSAFVAGRAASAADLKLLGAELISFYGQHTHRKLTLASVQGQILDSFAGEGHLELRERYVEAHREVGTLEGELDSLRGIDAARARDVDLLSFELEEIDQLDPSAAEHIELVTERDRLAAVDGLRRAAVEALGAIAPTDDEPGARAAIAAADAATRRAAGSDPQLDRLADRLGALDAELEDLASELR